MSTTVRRPEKDVRLRVLLAGAAVAWALLWWSNERIWDALVTWAGLDLDSRSVGSGTDLS